VNAIDQCSHVGPELGTHLPHFGREPGTLRMRRWCAITAAMSAVNTAVPPVTTIATVLLDPMPEHDAACDQGMAMIIAPLSGVCGACSLSSWG
jgi:hypothetical protein